MCVILRCITLYFTQFHGSDDDVAGLAKAVGAVSLQPEVLSIPGTDVNVQASIKSNTLAVKGKV